MVALSLRCCAKGIARLQAGCLGPFASIVHGRHKRDGALPSNEHLHECLVRGVTLILSLVMQKRYAVCLRKGRGSCVCIYVAPCALRYLFAAFVLVLIKDDRALFILISVFGR